MIQLIAAMNMIDAFLTFYWIQTNQATEANPVMKVLLDFSPILFLTTKIFGVMFGLWLIHTRKELWLSKAGMLLLVTVYSYVMFVHFRYILWAPI